MRFKLQCNFCAEKFVHVGDDYPDECPLCHAYVGLDGKPEVSLPAISLAKNRSPDLLYRGMEDGAKHRIDVAADHLGIPTSELSDLKMTNMKDGLRPGDISAPAVRKVNDVQATFGGATPEQHAATLQAVRSGPSPNAGSGQIPVINSLHQKFAKQMVARGTQNSYTG